jgi:ubiquitin carboxyl-terminal hydrolase 7
MIPRAGRISDLLESLQAKANIPDDVMKRVQVYEAHGNKWYKSLSPETAVMSISEYFTVYAAPAPEGAETDKMITVFHFDKEPAKVHGIPFKFPLIEVCSKLVP